MGCLVIWIRCIVGHLVGTTYKTSLRVMHHQVGAVGNIAPPHIAAVKTRHHKITPGLSLQRKSSLLLDSYVPATVAKIIFCAGIYTWKQHQGSRRNFRLIQFIKVLISLLLSCANANGRHKLLPTEACRGNCGHTSQVQTRSWQYARYHQPCLLF